MITVKYHEIIILKMLSFKGFVDLKRTLIVEALNVMNANRLWQTQSINTIHLVDVLLKCRREGKVLLPWNVYLEVVSRDPELLANESDIQAETARLHNVVSRTPSVAVNFQNHLTN